MVRGMRPTRRRSLPSRTKTRVKKADAAVERAGAGPEHEKPAESGIRQDFRRETGPSFGKARFMPRKKVGKFPDFRKIHRPG
ncbi:MAG: hypothetical protein BAA03_05210 [Caldibacillus debilis]|nr:MAG: hypothetical protein BAA03_05210 [Caldibacillus debilis]